MQCRDAWKKSQSSFNQTWLWHNGDHRRPESPSPWRRVNLNQGLDLDSGEHGRPIVAHTVVQTQSPAVTQSNQIQDHPIRSVSIISAFRAEMERNARTRRRCAIIEGTKKRNAAASTSATPMAGMLYSSRIRPDRVSGKPGFPWHAMVLPDGFHWVRSETGFAQIHNEPFSRS